MQQGLLYPLSKSIVLIQLKYLENILLHVNDDKTKAAELSRVEFDRLVSDLIQDAKQGWSCALFFVPVTILVQSKWYRHIQRRATESNFQ